MLEALLRNIDACPTSAHVVQRASEIIIENGFDHVSLESPFTSGNLQHGYVARGGTIIAWKNAQTLSTDGIRIVGAHTDSPGLHIKTKPDTQTLNWQQLQVEVYGGPLLNSWLDRDLAIAGHVVLREGTTSLFSSVHPVPVQPVQHVLHFH